MKILFSADWHIKLGQKNVPREWQKERYSKLFEKIHELERRCDVHILGGDVFDTVPKPEELGMYFEFISKCDIPTYIYDGNHEATRKGKTFMTFLAEASKSINSNIHIVTGIEVHNIYNTSIDFIPYTHLKTFNPEEFNSSILCTHVRGDIKPHVKAEIDLEKLNRWKTVLAGDLHSYSNSQRNIIYPGSPLAISFHRNKIVNGVIIYNTDTNTHEFIDLELPQLLRKTVDNKEDIVSGDYDHIIYEVTGNLLELAGISSDLIDKKLVNNTTIARLDFSNMSIEEELGLYLSDIHDMFPDSIKDIVGVFNDYYRES